MRRLLLFCLLPALLAAEDHWVRFTSGPYEVLTDAGPSAGREAIVRFEEFRAALGQIAGEQDLQTPMPVRIMVFKNAKGWMSPIAPVSAGRDRYNIVLEEKQSVPPDVYRQLTRLFLQSNTSQMPLRFEHGLVEFFSTFDVKGIHITVGAPPAQPDLDWARVHLLVLDPTYFGRLRVLLYNLRHGVDEDTSYRNAFGKSAAEVEAQAKRHFAAGNFQTGSIPSRPMAERDFPERAIAQSDVRLARADLLAANSAAEYRSLLNDGIKAAEAHEGLGLLALRDHRTGEARAEFAAAMEAGSTSARCYIEYAKLEPDNAKAANALLRAAGINPKLDEPFALLAERDTDSQKRIAHWKAAAERNPRNPRYWQSLAECYLADHNYGEAAKAWTAGEQSATDPAQRERMHAARMAIEQQRLDYEEAEKRRQAEQDAREIATLKEQALAQVHQLETKYSDKPSDPNQKPVPWWEGPKPDGHLEGSLQRVECLGKQARLVIQGADHKLVRLLVTDPAKIAIAGTGQLTLGCGVQKSRRVIIEYFSKANAKLSTAGEVATIQFQ
jgi:hypothetical protein